MGQKYFLKANIQAEPLINNWYAWHLLVNPVTYSLIRKKHHVPIMESYLKAPQVHARIVKENRMRGGPFIDFSSEDLVNKVALLLNRTKCENSKLFELADAIFELNKLLQDNAAGQSLIPLYAQVPDALKGYVELVYDLNNNPSFRLLESLLYKSDYYSDRGQSLLLSQAIQKERPFVLSTPRFAHSKQLSLNLPFKHPDIDMLFRSRNYGVSKRYLQKLFKSNFEITEPNEQLFWSLFEEKPSESKADSAFPRKSTKVRYFGHACVLIQTPNVNILVDPLVSYGYDKGVERYTISDLPEVIDYVLLTHAHQDHVMLETLLQIRHKVKEVVVPKNNPGALQDTSLKLMLQQIGFPNVREAGELDSIVIPGGEIVALPFLGEHGDLNIVSKVGFLIQVHNKRIMCVADSNNLMPAMYEHLKKVFGSIDVIFLGMECEGAPMSWLYGPLFLSRVSWSMDQSRRLDGSDAQRALGLIETFDCKRVYIYAMGQEPWLSYITNIFYENDSKPIVESNKLIDIGKMRGIKIERLYLMKDLNI